MEPRHPKDSVVTMTELVLPQHTNTLGTCFGGQVLSWIDIAASVCAGRHAGGVCVTVAFDDVHFKLPIQLGDIVHIEARMAYVGRSSMEIAIECSRETFAGCRQLAIEAFVTFVALDADGKPKPVPGLEIKTDKDRSLMEQALARREQRLQRAGRSA